MANASLVRGTDTCTRPEGACGSVRAMPEHNTCRCGFVITGEHPHLTCVRWERIGCGRRCPLAWAHHPLLTSTARTAIHVVHVRFGRVGTVVFLVGTSLNLLGFVDSLNAEVLRKPLL